MSYSHRGELWSYATEQHRTMISMRVDSDRLLWPEQYRKLRRSMRRKQRAWEQKMGRMISKHGEKYGFWM
jgi:hypothetical protein